MTKTKKYNNAYLPNYANGGFIDWAKENKEGIIGGAQMLAGGLMTATGVGAPLGMSLMAGGAAGLASEVMDGNSQDGIQKSMAGPQANQLSSAPTFPMGGRIPYPNAELEQGEVYKTPDGNIEEIKDKASLSHKNGGVPGQYEPGTQVLGKLKDKQTGMKFKEIGQKIAAQKRKLNKLRDENKNTLTQNAIKAMDQKLNKEFDMYYQRQESSKPRLRKGQKMAAGGDIPPWYGDPKYSMFHTREGASNFTKGAADFMGNMMYQQALINAEADYTQPTTQLTPKATVAPTTPKQPYTPKYDMSKVFAGQAPTIEQTLGGAQPTLQSAGTRTMPTPTIDNGSLGFGQKLQQGLGGNGLNMAAQMAPLAYNLAQGLRKPEEEKLPAQYNQALCALRNRKFNIDPILEANRTAQAVGDYNSKSYGGGATRS